MIYEDDHVVVFNKPSGLQVLPANEFLENTLLSFARRYYQQRNEANIASIISPVHRLGNLREMIILILIQGRGTSGAILFTKSITHCQVLSAAMANREFEKKYLALVEGIIESEGEVIIEQPIGPVPYSAISITGSIFAATPDGKYAKSVFRVLKKNKENNNTLVEVEIYTGRPHQIRIHMASIGHPLVGDPLYSSGGLPTKMVESTNEGIREAVPGDCGYLLHSWKLGFPKVGTYEMIKIICNPPDVLNPL